MILDGLCIRRQYRDYLEHLLEYLVSFFQRTEPLQDLDRMFSKVLSLSPLFSSDTTHFNLDILSCLQLVVAFTNFAIFRAHVLHIRTQTNVSVY